MSFYGEIKIFPYTYAPRDWFFCNGDRLLIENYTSLFSVVYDNYGPIEANKYFYIPNLINRVPICFGNDIYNGFVYQLGNPGGSDTATLNITQFPIHNHNIVIAKGSSNIKATTGSMMCSISSSPTVNLYKEYSNADVQKMMNINMLQPTGAPAYTTLHSNVQPTLIMNHCICVSNADYPVRS